MRTTIDLPEATLRQLKARAALEGVPMKDLVLGYVQHGLARRPAPARSAARSPLPDLVPNKPLALRRPSNAGLFAVLDEADAQRATGGRRDGGTACPLSRRSSRRQRLVGAGHAVAWYPSGQLTLNFDSRPGMLVSTNFCVDTWTFPGRDRRLQHRPGAAGGGTPRSSGLG